jgi:predicted ATPase
LDWSYDLLSETESKVLQRLSVFSGGATLEAVESICAEDGVEADGVLDTLSQLVDKSLVMTDQRSSETRYSLLETIRQYAHEKLIESGEFDSARDRHLHYFVEWAEMANVGLAGMEQSDWLNRFEIEHDNLRAALEWCATNERY